MPIRFSYNYKYFWNEGMRIRIRHGQLTLLEKPKVICIIKFQRQASSVTVHNTEKHFVFDNEPYYMRIN